MGNLFIGKRLLALAGVIAALCCVGITHLLAMKQLVDDITDDETDSEDKNPFEEQ